MNYPLSKVCRTLKINRNKYYYIRSRAKLEKHITEIERKILEMYNKHIGNYGRRRIKRELDIVVSEHLISRVLKKYGLTAKAGRGKVGKNIHTEKGYIYDNKIKELGLPDKVNTIWSADISEFTCKDGKIQVSGVIDITGKAVVLETGMSPNASLVDSNLKKALQVLGRPKYYHTDRGSAYVSTRIKETLNKANIIHSMSAPYKPNENQYIETFWKTMKTEIGNTRNFTTEQLIGVIKYYEHYYNYERLHSSIGYAYPMEYSRRQQSCH